MTMAPYLLWAIGGLALMSAELMLPGVYLLWIGLAALLTAPLVWTLDLGLVAQLVAFAVLCVGLVALGWRIGGRLGSARSGDPNAAADALVGELGTITAPGRVAIRDGAWSAEPPDLPLGTLVVVTGRRGLTLEVAPRLRHPAEPPT